MKEISEYNIDGLAADNEGNVYVGTNNGNGAGNLYKSNTDGSFQLVNGWSKDNDYVSFLTVNKKDGTIYVGTENKGLYVTNPINLLIKIDKPNTFDKSWPLYLNEFCFKYSNCTPIVKRGRISM